jgi:hypothetical protein
VSQPYNKCKPIEGRVSSVWLVYFSDGREQLQVWHKDAKVEEIVEHVKMHDKQQFLVGQIDVGEFNLDPETPISHSYSSDGRQVNQDMEMVHMEEEMKFRDAAKKEKENDDR